MKAEGCWFRQPIDIGGPFYKKKISLYFWSKKTN